MPYLRLILPVYIEVTLEALQGQTQTPPPTLGRCFYDLFPSLTILSQTLTFSETHLGLKEREEDTILMCVNMHKMVKKNDRRCWFYHEFLRDCVIHRKIGRGIAALCILGIRRSGEAGLVILNITVRLTLTRVWEININKHAYINLHYNQKCEVP